MLSPLTRNALSGLPLCTVLSIGTAAAQTPADATSADARLQALYAAEWTWRQPELARASDAPGDAGAAAHFPRVDAASQQARLAYWTRALATFDNIPLAELSSEESINAQVFRTSVTALANDVT